MSPEEAKAQCARERLESQRKLDALLAALTPEQRARFNRRKKARETRAKATTDLLNITYRIIRIRKQLMEREDKWRGESHAKLRADLDALQLKLEVVMLKKMGVWQRGSWDDDLAAVYGKRTSKKAAGETPALPAKEALAA